MADPVAWLTVCYDRAEQRALDLLRQMREADAQWRLADIARKRAILAEHAETSHRDCRLCGHREADYPCTTVRLLAAEFAGEPGCDERWRP